MTEAERKLWRHLRRLPPKQSHFRKQATIGPYFADFACHAQRVVIEVDGAGHIEPAQVAHDLKRLEYLKAQGYRVLRFWNNEVLNEIEAVMTAIHSTLTEASRTIPPTPNPSPPLASLAGGGESKRRV